VHHERNARTAQLSSSGTMSNPYSLLRTTLLTHIQTKSDELAWPRNNTVPLQLTLERYICVESMLLPLVPFDIVPRKPALERQRGKRAHFVQLGRGYRRVLGPTWSATSGRETKLILDIRRQGLQSDVADLAEIATWPWSAHASLSLAPNSCHGTMQHSSAATCCAPTSPCTPCPPA
jgi:hypothetical protein